jgi:4-amino-4-deoxy-L-arabinose transferase-like glycosyltransferase
MTDHNQVSVRNRLMFLLALVFISRLLAALVILGFDGAAGFGSPDTATYVGLAASLVHGSFSSNGVPDVVRTPGYPLLLVPAVASYHPTLIALFENLLLATVSAWLIWKIVREIAPFSKACVWAVLLYCFEPVGFLYSEKILSDLLFCTELLFFLWLTVGFLRSPRYATLLGSSVALGLATYTRPVSLFLGIWMAAFFLLVPRRLPWSSRIPKATAFVLVFTITLLPWFVRNQKLAGYRGFSAITDESLYFYSAAAVKAKLEHKSFSRVQEELGWNDNQRYFQSHPEQRDWSQGQVFRFQNAEARRIISQHLLTYSLIHLRGCAVVMLDPAVTEIMKLLRRYPQNGALLSRAVDQGFLRAVLWLVRQYPETALALPVLGAQLLLYYFLGLVGLRRLPIEEGALLVWLFTYFVLVSGSSAAVARFRMPIMPLVCISAGIAIADWADKRRHLAAASRDPASAGSPKESHGRSAFATLISFRQFAAGVGRTEPC